MVRGDADDRIQTEELANLCVDGSVKGECLGLRRRVLVLNEVRGREVKKIRPPLFEEADTGSQDVHASLTAVDRRRGTHQRFDMVKTALMTTPVGDVQVVLAKFTGALLFYLITWLPLLGCIFIVRYYSNDPTALGPGPVASTYLGLLLIGCLYISLGIFASSITRSQMIAVIFGIALDYALFMLSFLSTALETQRGWEAQIIAHLGLQEHMRDFAAGVVDSRPVVLYLTLTVFFLFLSWKTVESRRWK